MNNAKYHLCLVISIVSFFSSLLFFALYNQIILFRSPWSTSITMDFSSTIQKKQVTHYYFHQEKWKTEKQELLWSEKAEKNIFQLINAWLTLLYEEHITIKKIALQSVLISTSGCAYLSFDHNILNKEDTIFKKWMFIEGLLKTIALNDIKIQHVQFLIQHQPLSNTHLDFSMPWPINGFMK